MQKLNITSRAGMRSSTVALPVRRATAASRRACIRTAAQAEAKNGFAKWSDSVGMPTDDGIFGFTPFAEMWVGRWAQLGFVSSIVTEFATGRGTLQQVGLASPSTPVLIAMIAVFGGATLAGTISTVQRATSKKMSRTEIARYKTFLGLNNQDDYKAEALAMKQRGDFTTPGLNQKAIDAARSQGSPVDSFLSTNEVSEGEQAAQAMKASASTATLERVATPEEEAAAQAAAAAKLAAERAERAKMYEEALYFGEKGELAYARGIELTNGRWAMIGFLTAIVVESVTGQGIIGQLIAIFKWSGLLGEKSGF